MANNKYYADEIKRRVTMHDVITRYGFKADRHKRIPCPFHNGEDNNLGYKSDFFKCFVCGVSGDVITFVQKYYDLSFNDTLARMDEDFALGFQIGRDLRESERRAIAKRAFEAKMERKKKQMARERLDKAYHDAYDELARLDRQLMEHKPRDGDEEIHPLYLEALQGIETARYRLERAEEEIYNYEQRNNTNT